MVLETNDFAYNYTHLYIPTYSQLLLQFLHEPFQGFGFAIIQNSVFSHE